MNFSPERRRLVSRIVIAGGSLATGAIAAGATNSLESLPSCVELPSRQRRACGDDLATEVAVKVGISLGVAAVTTVLPEFTDPVEINRRDVFDRLLRRAGFPFLAFDIALTYPLLRRVQEDQVNNPK